MELEDLFFDILYTSDNPVVIRVEKVFKDGEIIKRDCKEYKYDLVSENLISELRNCNKIEIEFYQRGIISIFKKFKIGDAYEYFNNLSPDRFMIMNEQTRMNIFKLNIPNDDIIFSDDLDDDEIIVGSRYSTCIINKKTREYYFDKSSIDVIYLT